MLVEFWDFCRPNSLRTLPYVRAWHERYADAGLRVIGVHSPGFAPSATRPRCAPPWRGWRSTIRSCVDFDFEVWQPTATEGWPARYLFDRALTLVDYHYGEGAYDETERAIRELLGRRARPPSRRCGPRTRPAPRSSPQTADQEGAYSGPYEAGGVWAVLSGAGALSANGREIAVDGPGAYALLEHERNTAGVLELAVGDGRDLPRHVLHPRPGAGLSSARLACAVAEQAPQPRRAVRRSTITPCPASTGCASGPPRHEEALVDPRAGVEHARRRRRATRQGRRRPAGRCGGCGRRRTCARRDAEPAHDLAHRPQAGTAQLGAREVGAAPARARARLSAAIAAGKPTPPARGARAGAPAVAGERLARPARRARDPRRGARRAAWAQRVSSA